MAVLGIDLGGTKLALALFSEDGVIVQRINVPLNNKKGKEVGGLICDNILNLKKETEDRNQKIRSIGISVPGISRKSTGTVWAPNIKGWEDYPLLDEVKEVAGHIPVIIDSDRACYISGECWQGNARECTDAIFLAVGTGVGAGIMINKEILRGSNDIAGAIGWMALSGNYEDGYKECGCFESYASGEGIARQARMRVARLGASYSGVLKNNKNGEITTPDIFSAFDLDDAVALYVIDQAIRYWGMAVANLVSLFNPEKIIFGGGVFGPAVRFLPRIMDEAEKWAQPISIRQVKIEGSLLGGDAGVVGAGYLALKSIGQ